MEGPRLVCSLDNSHRRRERVRGGTRLDLINGHASGIPIRVFLRRLQTAPSASMLSTELYRPQRTQDREVRVGTRRARWIWLTSARAFATVPPRLISVCQNYLFA
jgi:hypothetical protein